MIRLALFLLPLSFRFSQGVTRGPPAMTTAMMHMHEYFADALDRIFDGEADVLVATKASMNKYVIMAV